MLVYYGLVVILHPAQQQLGGSLPHLIGGLSDGSEGRLKQACPRHIVKTHYRNLIGDFQGALACCVERAERHQVVGGEEGGKAGLIR